MNDRLQILIEAILSKTSEAEFEKRLQNIAKKNKIKVDVDTSAESQIKLSKSLEKIEAQKRKMALIDEKNYIKGQAESEKKLQYEQKLRIAIEKQEQSEKQKTKEIQKQIAFYKEELALKMKNAQTTYGKHYNSTAMSGILSQSDLLTVENFKDSSKQLNLNFDKSIAKSKQLRKEATLAMKESDTFTKTLSKDFGKMVAWTIVGTALFGSLRQLQQGLDTLKELDALMVEIAKVTDLSADAMDRLKNSSFDAADAFGRKSQDYLKSVAEFSRAGYDTQSESLSSLSLLLQNVGELTSEQANEFLLATDAAYKYKGSQEALLKVIDGANEIDNRYATSIAKVSEGITITGSIASNASVGIDELSAAIGTMTAITQRSGSEAGRAFRGILMNLRQLKGDIGDGEIIDDEALSKSAKALDAVGIKIHEMRNGFEELRDPMKILEQLSSIWDNLTSMQQAPIIDALGGKFRGNQLVALLENFNMYEKMLADYANASGSAIRENEKRMDSWEAKANQVANELSKFWNKSIDTDLVKKGLSSLKSLIDSFDNFGRVVTFVGAILLTFNAKSVAGLLMNIPKLVTGLGKSIANLFSFKTAIGEASLAASNFQRTLTLAGIALTVITIAVSAYNEAKEKQLQLAEENKAKLKEEQSALENLRESYSDIIKSGDITESSKIRLKSIQDQLIETYHLEADAIDLINGKYTQQISIIDDLIIKKAEQVNASIAGDYQIAKAELEKIEAAYAKLTDMGRMEWGSTSDRFRDILLGSGFESQDGRERGRLGVFNKTLEDRVKIFEEAITKISKYNDLTEQERELLVRLQNEYNTLKGEFDKYTSTVDDYTQRQSLIDFNKMFGEEISTVKSLMLELNTAADKSTVATKLAIIKAEMIKLAVASGKLEEFLPLFNTLFATNSGTSEGYGGYDSSSTKSNYKPNTRQEALKDLLQADKISLKYYYEELLKIEQAEFKGYEKKSAQQLERELRSTSETVAKKTEQYLNLRNEIGSTFEKLNKESEHEISLSFESYDKQIKAFDNSLSTLGNINTIEEKAKETEILGEKFRITQDEIKRLEQQLLSPTLSDSMRELIQDRKIKLEIDIVKFKDSVEEAMTELTNIEKSNAIKFLENYYTKLIEKREKEIYGGTTQKVYEEASNARIEAFENQITALEQQSNLISEQAERQQKLLDIEKQRLALENAKKVKQKTFVEGKGYVLTEDTALVKQEQDKLSQIQEDYTKWESDLNRKRQSDFLRQAIEFERTKQEEKRKLYDSTKTTLDAELQYEIGEIENHYKDLDIQVAAGLETLKTTYGNKWDEILKVLEEKLLKAKELQAQLDAANFAMQQAALKTTFTTTTTVSATKHDTGGMLQSGNLAINLSGKPEYILDPNATKSFIDFTSMLKKIDITRMFNISSPTYPSFSPAMAGGGGSGINIEQLVVNAPNGATLTSILDDAKRNYKVK